MNVINFPTPDAHSFLSFLRFYGVFISEADVGLWPGISLCGVSVLPNQLHCSGESSLHKNI